MNSTYNNARQSRTEARLRDSFVGFMVLAMLIASAIGAWAASVHKLLTKEADVLLAVGGATVALLAVVLAALALVTTFLEGRYGQIIGSADSVKKFLRPFTFVATVNALAAIVSFVGAIDSDAASGPTALRASVFGLAMFLAIWAILGTLGLISVFTEFAQKRRKYEDDIENAMNA